MTKHEDFIALAKEIKKKRVELGISRPQLSDLSGVPARTIQDWEDGKRKIKSIYVLRVCKILDIDINIFFEV